MWSMESRSLWMEPGNSAQPGVQGMAPCDLTGLAEVLLPGEPVRDQSVMKFMKCYVTARNQKTDSLKMISLLIISFIHHCCSRILSLLCGT